MSVNEQADRNEKFKNKVILFSTWEGNNHAGRKL
jgi:hypothetical protein